MKFSAGEVTNKQNEIFKINLKPRNHWLLCVGTEKMQTCQAEGMSIIFPFYFFLSFFVKKKRKAVKIKISKIITTLK